MNNKKKYRDFFIRNDQNTDVNARKYMWINGLFGQVRVINKDGSGKLKHRRNLSRNTIKFKKVTRPTIYRLSETFWRRGLLLC
jgi:hypothetical protein